MYDTKGPTDISNWYGSSKLHPIPGIFLTAMAIFHLTVYSCAVVHLEKAVCIEASHLCHAEAAVVGGSGFGTDPAGGSGARHCHRFLVVGSIQPCHEKFK